MKLKTLELRGQLHKDKSSGATASFYAEPDSGSDWSYVPAMALMGLVNKDMRLPMTGTFLAQKPVSWRAGNIRAVVRSLKKPALAFDFLLADEKDSRVLTFTEGPVMKQLDADRWLLEQPIPRGMPWPQAPSLYLMAELYPLQQDCHE